MLNHVTWQIVTNILKDWSPKSKWQFDTKDESIIIFPNIGNYLTISVV